MRNERIGLLLIACSLIAIFTISALFLQAQRDTRRDLIQNQGVSLARLLSSISYSRLVPESGRHGPLNVMVQSQGNPDFAYGAVTGLDGLNLAEVTAPGVIVPALAAPEDLPIALGQRTVPDHGTNGPYHEFFAPVLREGRVEAYVRVGFSDPGYPMPHELSLLAMLALPVFLLTPLAYFLIRREIRPLAALHTQLRSELVEAPVQGVEIRASGEVGDFIRSFNDFVQLTEERMRTVRREQTGLLASTKVASYEKARVELALEALPDAAVLLDDAGVATFANTKLRALLGVDPVDAMGRSISEWCRPAELSKFLAGYESGGLRRRRPGALELCPDEQSDLRIRVTAHPLRTDADSPATGTLVVLRDITAETLAAKAQKEFISHVAHELKAPLNVMGMYGESLATEDGESEKFRIDASNVIRDEVERLSTLIHCLLNIARLETGAITPQRVRVRLGEFLKDVLDTASRGAEKRGIVCTLDLPKALTSVHVDKDLFRIALNNLVTNAIKYNRDGGTVTLSVQDEPNQIEIHVIDSGIGIGPEDRERLFEKFFRSDDREVRQRSGHGLGLSLSKEIVELHGGRFVVESVVGQGSDFAIVLEKTPTLLRQSEDA